jgi:hypothetical protein
MYVGDGSSVMSGFALRSE